MEMAARLEVAIIFIFVFTMVYLEIKKHQPKPVRVIQKERDQLLGVPRSSGWPKVRKAHLEKEPRCRVCNGIHRLNVHHIRDFKDFPELELDPNNLITLCEDMKNGLNCHLVVGHAGNFKCINPHVVEDAALLNDRITNRQNGSRAYGKSEPRL